MSVELFRQHLKATRPIGFLIVTLLGLGLGGILFIALLIGDCEPMPRCREIDRTFDGLSVLVIAVTVLASGSLGWCASALSRMLLQSKIGVTATNLFLAALTLAIICMGFALSTNQMLAMM